MARGQGVHVDHAHPFCDLFSQFLHAHSLTYDLIGTEDLGLDRRFEDRALADAWQSLGMALVKLEKLDEAIPALQKLIQLKPRDQLAYSSLSLALGRAGRIKEAEEMAAKAKVAAWGGDPTKLQA
jgi:tetratricopeptide (TPR) repeat protein